MCVWACSDFACCLSGGARGEREEATEAGVHRPVAGDTEEMLPAPAAPDETKEDWEKGNSIRGEEDRR